MSESKEPRAVAAGTLLSQWWTLGAIALDSRTAGRHMTAAWVIIDRYMQSRGNARASLRYIENATGLSKPTVIGACRELVEWGYFSRHLGVGTRPTEYAPNWLVVNPSLPLASGQQGLTTGGQDGSTTTGASGEQGLTKDLLTSPADKPADSKVGNTNTPDPLVAGLSAATGSRDPESAFDRFWQSFPRKHQKPKARVAWAKLNPDADLAERIVVAAGEWAEHYAENPVDKKWMPAPANWLAGERYDEDLPSVYVDAKEAAIARAKDKPKPAAKPKHVEPNDDDKDLEDVAAAKVAPAKRDQEYVIEKADIVSDQFSETLKLMMRGVEDGLCRPRNICVQHKREDEQAKGRKEFDRLLDACKLQLSDDLDSADFVGRAIMITADNEIQRPWEPPPRVDRPPIKFMPRYSVIPREATIARERAKDWAAQFNDDEEEAA